MNMFSFLETTLRNTALGIWQSMKRENPQKIIDLKALGDNPYNFTSFMRTLVLGLDPARESTFIQDTAIRNLEQLTINSFDYIVPFSQDFTALIGTAGKAFNEELCNKYFLKLPGDLGKQIHEKWNQDYSHNTGLGIGPRIQFTFMYLSEKCKEIILQEQIKRHL